VAAFHAGDATAHRVVNHASRVLGLGIAALIGALNVRHIVLVGPAAVLGPEWVAGIRDAAKASALPLLARDTVIEIGRAEENAVLLGASALLMTEQLGLSPSRR
jgi:predicted NBD/HSP70 family sugar kinase